MVLWSWQLPLPGAQQKFSKKSSDLVSSEPYPHSFPSFPMCLRRKAPKSVLCGSEWPYLLHLVHRWQAQPCSLHWSEHPLLLTGLQDQGDCCFFIINLRISHHASTPLWFYLLLKNKEAQSVIISPFGHLPIASTPSSSCSTLFHLCKLFEDTGFSWFLVIPFNVPGFF